MKNRTALGWGELILGILLIVLGIYTFVNPSSAMTGVTVLYGILAIVTGVIDIVFYAKLEQRTGFGPALSLVSGILSVIAGILIMCDLAIGEWVLIVLFPIWFIAHCISELTHLPFIRMTAGNGYYYFTLIANILGLILGFMMIFNPLISFLSASYMIGIYLLILGIDSLVFSLTLLDSRR